MDEIEKLGMIDQTTRRGRANFAYMVNAGMTLDFDHRPAEEFAWLRNPKNPAEPAVKRFTILAELGRIRNPSVMINIATWLCEEKPLTARALPYIRQMRMMLDHPETTEGEEEETA